MVQPYTMKNAIQSITLVLSLLLFTGIANAQNKGGTWTKKSYTASGKWSIVQDASGQKVVLDADFKTKKGPDLKIFLSPKTVAEVNGKNATTGSVFHCEKYSKLWAAGAL